MKHKIKIYQGHLFKNNTYLGEAEVSWIPRLNDSVVFKGKYYMVIQADLDIDTDKTTIFVEN